MVIPVVNGPGAAAAPAAAASRLLAGADLDALLAALRERGYTVIGPTVRDGAIVYEEVAGVAELPAGLTEVQEASRYRLAERGDRALFGYTVGPHSWKRFVFPPRVRLWRLRRAGDSFVAADGDGGEPEPRYAFLGVRSCDLQALVVQDRVFLGAVEPDELYRRRRQGAFVVAVQCGQSAATCFCVSMRSGPRAEAGFDLALTELLDGDRHDFLVEVGSARGAEVLAELPTRPAATTDRQAAAAATAHAVAGQTRRLEPDGLRDLLLDHQEDAHWDDVAARCLSCANCTLVCPTCFCSSIEDTSDLDGSHAERWRRWDSCFSLDHSYLHGGSVRGSVRSRYRMWLTHKLGTWVDQFGSSGCVGCGRCIAWCPVGIDLTAEVAALRAAAAEEEEAGEEEG